MFADGHVQGQLAEERCVVFLGNAFAAAVAEEGLFVAAVAADVDAHVFDDADHRDVECLLGALHAGLVEASHRDRVKALALGMAEELTTGIGSEADT